MDQRRLSPPSREGPRQVCRGEVSGAARWTARTRSVATAGTGLLIVAFALAQSPPIDDSDPPREVPTQTVTADGLADGRIPEFGPDADRWVHRRWTVQDGLPVDTLSGIAQDDDGYLWIGTYDGLVRFDGHRFVTLRPADEPALAGPRVEAVVRSPRCLWFLTSAGLTRLRGGELQQVEPPSTEDGAFVGLRRERGRLWVLAQHALFEVDASGELSRVETLPQEHDLSGLFIDSRERLWLQTTGGIAWREATGGIAGRETSELRWRLTAAPVNGALEVEDGILFYRQDRTPLLFAGGTWLEDPDSPIPGFELFGTSSVAETPWGDRYLVHRGRSLRQDGERLELLDAEASSSAYALKLSFASLDAEGRRWVTSGPTVSVDGEPVLRVSEDAAAQALEVDRTGTVWVATSSDGLHALSPASISMVDERSGLGETNAYAVYEDARGALWVGTQGGGVWRYSSGRWERDPLLERPARPVFARSFLDDGAGGVWIGLLGGLYRWSDGEVQVVEEAGAPRISVDALVRGPQGRIWAGTRAGVLRREPAPQGPEWRRVDPESLDLGGVRDLAWSPAGALWVATTNGLARYEGARWTVYGREHGLATTFLRGLTFDSEGILWVGSDDGGLARVEVDTGDGSPRITVYGPENGLDTTSVHHILEDGLDNLWLSSNRGILRVPRQDLEDVASGRRTSVRAVLFDELDGMNDREANGGTGNSGLRSADGRLWFATQDGVAVIDPGSLRPSAPATGATGATVIEAVEVGRATLAGHGDQLAVLEPEQRSFSVQYTSTVPSQARRARFRYRLVGYDDTWQLADERRQAFYTGVPAGSYRFEVETLEVPGLLRGSRDTISISVRPFFWETSWFRMLALVAVIGALASALRWNHLRQRRRQRELEETVRERTAVIRDQTDRLRRLDQVKSDLFTDVSHEFRTPLTLTIGPLQDLLDGARGSLDPPVEEDVSLALRNARRVLDLINQILDVARMEAGQVGLDKGLHDLESFLRERLSAFTHLADREGVTLAFCWKERGERAGGPSPEGGGRAWFDRQRLGRSVDNLLLNALQWTPAGGSVELGLARGPSRRSLDEGDPRESKLGDADRESGESFDLYEITVDDTGPGVSAADLERIFLRFQRGEEEPSTGTAADSPDPDPDDAGSPASSARSQVRRWIGTGIGLAQTREIVQLHGGDLTVHNINGVGASFCILLPSLPPDRSPDRSTVPAGTASVTEGTLEAADGDAGESPSAEGSGRLTSSRVPDAPSDAELEEATAEDVLPLVLVVDDQEEIRDYLRRILEPECRVIEAADGEQALRSAQGSLPDLVISDVMMPGMDGVALVRAMQSDPELDFVPVVLLTARGGEEDRLSGLELGVDDYLVKPFQARELLNRMDHLLARRAQWGRVSSVSAPAESDAPPGSAALHLPARDVQPADADLLQRIVQAIEENLDDADFGVEALATRLRCDRTYLFRKLRDLTGETPSALLRRLRLERAEEMLRARAGNVSEVAYSVGFRSVSHFSQSFKQHYGTTPSSWSAHLD